MSRRRSFCRTGTGMKRIYMDRFIDTIEWIAAGFVGIVAADIFLSVVLRNVFNYAIPDAFDFGRLLLGILIYAVLGKIADLLAYGLERRFLRWHPGYAKAR